MAFAVPHRQSAENYSLNLGGTTDNNVRPKHVVKRIAIRSTAWDFLLYSVNFKFGGLFHGKTL